MEADGNSRLQLPKDLILFAGIQKQVVLSSSVNMIEIWDKAQYEKVLKEASVDFSDLAEEVMGENKSKINGVSSRCFDK